MVMATGLQEGTRKLIRKNCWWSAAKLMIFEGRSANSLTLPRHHGPSHAERYDDNSFCAYESWFFVLSISAYLD
jgi:hypothetical protein